MIKERQIIQEHLQDKFKVIQENAHNIEQLEQELIGAQQQSKTLNNKTTYNKYLNKLK